MDRSKFFVKVSYEIIDVNKNGSGKISQEGCSGGRGAGALGGCPKMSKY